MLRQLLRALLTKPEASVAAPSMAGLPRAHWSAPATVGVPGRYGSATVAASSEVSAASGAGGPGPSSDAHGHAGE